jgi:hypothetical protein
MSLGSESGIAIMGAAHRQTTSTKRALGTTGSGSGEFLIVYPAAAHEELERAVYALYYLPQHYKLVVLTADAAQSEGNHQAMTLLHGDALMRRVSFDHVTEVPEASPFSFASMVIYGKDNTMPRATATPQIDSQTTDSPEALASAILKAARA